MCICIPICIPIYVCKCRYIACVFFKFIYSSIYIYLYLFMYAKQVHVSAMPHAVCITDYIDRWIDR